MKQFLWVLGFMLCANFVSSQISTDNWESKMGDPNVSFFEIQDAYNAYWEGKEIPKGAGHKPFKRWEYLMETRVDKDGYYNPLERHIEYQRYLKANPNYKSSSNQWSILGPEGEPSGNNGVGRINVIAVHPTNSNKIYAGTPAGGLWISTDGGASWTTNTDGLTNLGISDIVFDPANADNMWAATGDRDHNDTSTFGIISSTDGGASWTTTSFQPSTNGLPGFYLIHRLLIDPNDGDVMIASTTSGVWRTTDGWSTWTEVLPNDCLRHMEFKPGDSNIVYGTTSGSYCGGLNNVATYFRSTDNGASWTQITLPNTVDLERIGIGVTDDNPSKLYLLTSHNDSGNNNDFFALYQSTDSGATITEVSVNTVPDLGSQQWYD